MALGALPERGGAAQQTGPQLELCVSVGLEVPSWMRHPGEPRPPSHRDGRREEAQDWTGGREFPLAQGLNGFLLPGKRGLISFLLLHFLPPASGSVRQEWANAWNWAPGFPASGEDALTRTHGLFTAGVHDSRGQALLPKGSLSLTLQERGCGVLLLPLPTLPFLGLLLGTHLGLSKAWAVQKVRFGLLTLDVFSQCWFNDTLAPGSYLSQPLGLASSLLSCEHRNLFRGCPTSLAKEEVVL